MGAGGCNAPGHPTLLCATSATKPWNLKRPQSTWSVPRPALALLPESLTVGQPDLVTAQIEGEPLLFRTLLAIPSRRRQTAAARTLADAMLTTVRGRRAATS